MENRARYELEQMIQSMGGESELLELLADYRQLTRAFVTARDAGTVLPHARCWWSEKQKLRLGLHLGLQHAAVLARKN